MSFLPPAPEKGFYMNLEEGDNTFRILGKSEEGTAIAGWEYWILKDVEGRMESRPVRSYKADKSLQAQCVIDQYDHQNFNFFWAFPVWSYSSSSVRLATIKQVTIQRFIEQQATNPKWGDVAGYDFIVTRDSKSKPMYTCSTNPKEELSEEIKAEYASLKITLDNWMNGGDPFEYSIELPEESKSEKNTKLTNKEVEVPEDLPFD